ncbi:metal ABC transporter substrate-binding protein [Actinomyces dentalis]|uniref:metal ABC transporter substrate-binding protein n=1 Tax=Actinomyces dentalis TaxID=272548 RepID=UPI0028EA9C58|nr:metal ABC transporter substrate-binding protein [Actinomyces dentalis]
MIPMNMLVTRARRHLAAVAVLALAGSLASCAALSPGSDSTAAASGAAPTAAASGALTVSTSFYPIQYLAQAIGGEHVAVTSVTPTNVEPHDFELSPKDVTALSASSLVLYVSGFQPSLDDALAQVSGPTVVDLAGSVDLVHHDGVEEEHEEGATEAATEAATGAAHDHGAAAALDPHFWLDPVRMQAAAKAVEAALAQADPAHADDYAANLDTLNATLTDLNTSYSTGLGHCERTTFVTSHAAFGYLADRYSLTQASISGVDPESEPSPAELAEVKKVVESTGTTTIFTEELVSPETAQAVAAETGAQTRVLSPIESAPESGDYAGVMRTNLEELRTALSCQ